ncbi:MAG: SOS response-associated peptidase, partial [Bacteroidales bacterium]|nr:SOS response-associated peptidase [Bacteroidales bacterium]
DEAKWISSKTDDDEAFSLLRPCPSEILKAHTISDLVNSRTANRNTPDVIKPYKRENNSLF